VFLTITTTGTSERPATDLGFLLHKHPDRAQTYSTTSGTAHVFYPEASVERCTAALLLEVDPATLLKRGRGKGREGSPDLALAHYVNDRPYAASSLLAVSARGGAELVSKLFEPLGWTSVTAEPVPLDEQFPEWGASRYVQLTLEGELRLSDALRQLYVLLPVLDGTKHYWVAPDEVDKLLRAGEGWLVNHPEWRLITHRYLSRRWRLTQQASERLELARLADADDIEVEAIDNAVAESAETAEALETADSESPEAAEQENDHGTAGIGGTSGPAVTAGVRESEGIEAADRTGVTSEMAEAAEKEPSLAVLRREAILGALCDAGATTVLDLGCGEGRLVQAMLKEPRILRVLGVDVSMRALTIASRRLKTHRMSERQAARVSLTQGSLTYTDKRLKGYDAAVLSEVIEHLDLPRLPALEYAVFGSARPATVVVTTPNAEYNVRWEALPAGHVRHADHRFEWTRQEFRGWAETVAERHGYTVAFAPVGPDDPDVGPPTQLAVFRILAKEARKAA
jgi:SAM-dependent methyltransferase